MSKDSGLPAHIEFIAAKISTMGSLSRVNARNFLAISLDAQPRPARRSAFSSSSLVVLYFSRIFSQVFSSAFRDPAQRIPFFMSAGRLKIHSQDYYNYRLYIILHNINERYIFILYTFIQYSVLLIYYYIILYYYIICILFVLYMYYYIYIIYIYIYIKKNF